jgi:hypothetical protein
MSFPLSYTDIRRFDDKLDAIIAGQARIESNQVVLINQGASLMATVQDLLQNMKDLQDLSKQYLDLIIAKDAAAAALQTQIADLVAAAGISAAEKEALQAAIDQAVAESQATEDALRAGLPGVPPVGGTPLAPSYADRVSFDAAVVAYTGPEAVTVDGVEVKAGTAPSLDYFSHSATGEVNVSGPTD